MKNYLEIEAIIWKDSSVFIYASAIATLRVVSKVLATCMKSVIWSNIEDIVLRDRITEFKLRVSCTLTRLHLASLSVCMEATVTHNSGVITESVASQRYIQLNTFFSMFGPKLVSLKLWQCVTLGLPKCGMLPLIMQLNAPSILISDFGQLSTTNENHWRCSMTPYG